MTTGYGLALACSTAYSFYAPSTLALLLPLALATPPYQVLGSPSLGTAADQYGNGFMQYYAQARDLPRSRPLRSARSRLG
jgi:hypothetical protein